VKILLVSHFFPPGHPGGTEVYTYGLATALRRLGHDLHVICAEDWGQGDTSHPRISDTTYEGIPVRRLSWNWAAAPSPFAYLYDNPDVNHHFATYLREFRPDVVHVTSCYAFGAGILEVARHARIPVVLTLTDFWFLCPRHTLWRSDGQLCPGPESPLTCSTCIAGSAKVYRVLDRALPGGLADHVIYTAARVSVIGRIRGFRGNIGDVAPRDAFLRRMFGLADLVLAPSQFLLDTFARNGFSAHRSDLSPYGHDLSWIDDLRPRPASGPVRIGYIGQIAPIKGVDLLIEAFQRLRSNCAGELWVYGNMAKDAPFAERLRRLAADNPRIRFMGPFERTEIARVLSELDVVAVPSVWYENTPIVISEAFAARRPVIATDLGGMSEIVHHNVNGLLFERGNVADLAVNLERCIEDSQLRQRLSGGIVAPRTIDEEVAELVSRYESVASAVAL
jgi:glycosyltransferase involved in cell wall biosynthesis